MVQWEEDPRVDSSTETQEWGHERNIQKSGKRNEGDKKPDNNILVENMEVNHRPVITHRRANQLESASGNHSSFELRCWLKLNLASFCVQFLPALHIWKLKLASSQMSSYRFDGELWWTLIFQLCHRFFHAIKVWTLTRPFQRQLTFFHMLTYPQSCLQFGVVWVFSYLCSNQAFLSLFLLLLKINTHLLFYSLVLLLF